jgi:hypothetical protein
MQFHVTFETLPLTLLLSSSFFITSHARSVNNLKLSYVNIQKTRRPGFGPLQRQNISSSLSVETSSEAHPASYQWVPGVNRGRGVTLTSHSI